MGFFAFMHRRFSSLETTEHDAELEVADVLKHWNAYVKTVPEKQRIIETTPFDLRKHLPELKTLLQTELDDLHCDVEDEENLFAEVDQIRYSHEIKNIKRLKERLDEEASEARYLFMLFEGLYNLVHSEMRLVRRLLEGTKDTGKIVRHLKEHILSEILHIKQIQEVIDRDGAENEQHLFHKLVSGSKILRKLNAKESTMRRGLEAHYQQGLPESMVKRWVDGVWAVLDKAVEEAYFKREIDDSPYMSLRFVNSDRLLSELAIKVLGTIRQDMEGIDMHHSLIKAFVEAFRDNCNDDYLFGDL